jgi:integrase
MLTDIKTNPKRIHCHPDEVMTPSGLVIRLDSSSWQVPTSSYTARLEFNRGSLASLEPELRDYGYERLASVSPSVSTFTLIVWLTYLPKYLQSISLDNLDWPDLTISILEGYLRHLRTRGIGYYFWHVQTVLKWIQLNRPGLVNPAVVYEVASWTIEGNAKGEAVALGHPHEGALTTAEADAIRAAAVNPQSPATLLERTVTLLLLETGQRNEQLSKLDTTDFKLINYKTSGDRRHHQPSQAVRHMVAMPSNKTARGKRDLSISAGLFNLSFQLIELTHSLRHSFEGEPAFIIDPLIQDVSQAWFDSDTERWTRIRRPNSWDIGSLVRSFCEKCGIINRFGDPINIFPRRFRRTVATRFVEQGASPEAVAALLDHADIQQVMVYFEFHKNRQQARLEEAAGSFFQSLGQSVEGKLIADATEARNPQARIPFFDDELQDTIGTANCGRDMEEIPLCHETIPYACYGCPFHQPWVSNVHKRVANSLRKRKESLTQIQGRDVGRLPSGLDSLIANVEAVVHAVDERQAATKQGRSKMC